MTRLGEAPASAEFPSYYVGKLNASVAINTDTDVNLGALSWTDTAYNLTLGSYRNTSNDRFVFPYAGRWLFTAQVNIDLGSGTRSRRLRQAMYNSAGTFLGYELWGEQSYGGYSNQTMVSISGVVYVAAANYFCTVQAWQNSGNSTSCFIRPSNGGSQISGTYVAMYWLGVT